MDFDQLNSFLEVARHSSFSKAAERCFRTQPAISSQIRALEEEVGARLFDRSGSKVTLTVAGKAFQSYAEDSLSALKAIKTTIAEMERTPVVPIGGRPIRGTGCNFLTLIECASFPGHKLRDQNA